MANQIIRGVGALNNQMVTKTPVANDLVVVPGSGVLCLVIVIIGEMNKNKDNI